ncbi:MAG: methyltransferase domain-containing protein [Balneolaceae bacterium]
MNNSRAESTINYYNKLSKKYDRGYSGYLKHTHAKLLENLKIPDGARVLDISCGTGILGSEIAEHFSISELVLNDPSEGMINIARERLADIENITFSQHIAEELPFEPDSFDVLICLNSFHYYTDHKKVVEHFRRLLKPGGTLYLLDWNLEGWFHLPNGIISAFSPEHINTKSASETDKLLSEFKFKIETLQRWSFRFWKFYLIKALLK